MKEISSFRRPFRKKKRLFSFNSLHSKMFFSFLIIVLIPTLLISYNSLRISSDVLNTNLENEILTARNIFEKRVLQKEVKQLESTVISKAEDELTREAIKSRNMISLLGIFSQSYMNKNELTFVEIQDVNGRKITGRGNIPAGFVPITEDVFNHVIKTRISFNEIGRSENGIYICTYQPVSDPKVQDIVTGMMLMGRTLTQGYWISLARDLNTEFILFDREGHLITSSFPELEKSLELDEVVLNDDDIFWFEDEINSLRYKLMVFPLTNFYNETFAYLALAKEETAIYNTARGIMKSVTLYAILGLVIALFLDLLLARSISKPIKKLISIVDTISKGDLTEEIEIKSHNEISLLAERINHMVYSLKNIVREVMESSNQVSAFAQELAASTEEASAVTEEVTATTEKITNDTLEQTNRTNRTSLLITEISNSINEVANGAQEVASKSLSAREYMERGQESIKILLASIERISAIVQQSAGTVAELDQRSTEIGKIIELISEIAEQTDMLALNAAIEAARAGEHGRGFAVVAEEVRQLATQSNIAAANISEILKMIQAETRNAVQIMNQGLQILEDGNRTITNAEETFADVIEAVKLSADASNNIALATEEQREGSARMVEAIEEIKNISADTSAGARMISQAVRELLNVIEGVSDSSRDLAEMAGGLNELIENFKI